MRRCLCFILCSILCFFDIISAAFFASVSFVAVVVVAAAAIICLLSFDLFTAPRTGSASFFNIFNVSATNYDLQLGKGGGGL